MNVEPQFHGLPDWHFPSPSSTPRSSAVEQRPFQTPKCEPSSHFLDAYYTPQITGQQTPATTPAALSSATFSLPPSNRPSPLTPNDPTFHVNHYKSGSLPLPPVAPVKRLASTSSVTRSSNSIQPAVHTPTVLRLGGAMDSFHVQMQTPPPTRDSSSRRGLDNGQGGAASTPGQMYPSASAQTPIAHVPSDAQQQQHAPQFHTPVQFHQMQYPSTAFGYSTNAPMSAPPMSNARFPWDVQSPSFSYANEAMMSSQTDAFGAPQPISPAFVQWHSPNPVSSQGVFETSFNHLDQSQSGDFWTTPALHTQASPSFNENTSFASTITTSGVNPSMIFSFTSPPLISDSSPVRPIITPQKIDTAFRQPYEHQMQESTREKEHAKKSKPSQNRAPVGSASISFGRPGLQRANTDSGTQKQRMSYIEPQRASQTLEQFERRPSPLKRNSLLSLRAIPESIRSRPKTRLVVGSDGRARTETITGHNDNQSEKSDWDQDSSDDDIEISSRRNSFGTSSSQLQRRPSKHARTGSDQDRFDPSKRPISSASVSSLASRLEMTPLGKRSSRDVKARRLSSGSFSGQFQGDSIGADNDHTMNEDSDDAQAALKKMIEGRSKRQGGSDAQARLNAHNQRWSQASLDMAKLTGLQDPPNTFDPFISTGSTSLSPTSGTDPDNLTPSTEHSTSSGMNTRCICNTTDSDGQFMIQCESCNKWLHVSCVGLDARRLPPVYICVYCTGTTPLVRNGRIREPLRRGEQAGVSPLNYKSSMIRR